MSGTCETVKVNRNGTPVIINKSDLSDSDNLWQSEEQKPVAKRGRKPKVESE